MANFSIVRLLVIALFSISVASCKFSDANDKAAADSGSGSGTPAGVQAISFQSFAQGNVILKGGSVTVVSWPLATGQSDIVSIMSSSDNGATWTTLEPYALNTGIYVLTVPANDSTNNLLKVIDPSTGNLIASSAKFQIVSTAPSLKSANFASRTAITTSEFVAVATSATVTPAPNPSLTGQTWTLDLANYVDAPIGFMTSAPVSHSQYGGPISCSNTICTYQVPVTSNTTDTFTIELYDSVGNQGPNITVIMNPNYAPPAQGGGGSGGGSGSSGGGGGSDQIPAPTLIPLASISDGGLTPAVQTYCPDLTTPPAAGIYRICNTGDVSVGCTGSQVLKPSYGSSFDSWTTALQNFIDAIPANSRLEIVYNNSNPVNYDPSDSSTGRFANEFTSCDININASNLTMVGVCGSASTRPTFKYATGQCSKDKSGSAKGSFINNGANNRFVNLKFKNNYISSSSGANGAAFRDQGQNTVFAFDYFLNGQNGILSGGNNNIEPPGAYVSFTLIENSRFESLGDGGGGLTHGIYLGPGVGHAYIRNNLFLRAKNHGHEAKVRSQQATIQCSVFSGRNPTGSSVETGWEDNALIDMPNGGKMDISFNTLVKGSNPANAPNIVAFTEEASINYYQDLSFHDNYVYNRRSGSFLLNYKYKDNSKGNMPTSLSIANNYIVGLGTSYIKSNFFNFLGGATDLSFDLTSYGNTLSDVVVSPYTGSDGQYVVAPGYPNSAANCPNFIWIQ